MNDSRGEVEDHRRGYEYIFGVWNVFSDVKRRKPQLERKWAAIPLKAPNEESWAEDDSLRHKL